MTSGHNIAIYKDYCAGLCQDDKKVMIEELQPLDLLVHGSVGHFLDR